MKKIGTLNVQLSRVIAGMGHTDRLVICDSGLPIPRDSEVIDLALTTNVPRFLDTLRVVLEELQVERAVLASEIKDKSNGLHTETLDLLNGIAVDYLPHEAFKQLTAEAGNITFVRTGEATPFANVVLYSGVTF